MMTAEEAIEAMRAAQIADYREELAAPIAVIAATLKKCEAELADWRASARGCPKCKRGQ